MTIWSEARAVTSSVRRKPRLGLDDIRDSVTPRVEEIGDDALQGVHLLVE
jgi:hypothetical protein